MPTSRPGDLARQRRQPNGEQRPPLALQRGLPRQAAPRRIAAACAGPAAPSSREAEPDWRRLRGRCASRPSPSRAVPSPSLAALLFVCLSLTALMENPVVLAERYYCSLALPPGGWFARHDPVSLIRSFGSSPARRRGPQLSRRLPAGHCRSRGAKATAGQKPTRARKVRLCEATRS
jgi:hypothetical protein